MISIRCRARRTLTTYAASTNLWLPLLLALALSLVGSAAQAQVDVTASAGTPAASYTTLKGAFDAINAGTHQGVIGIGLSGDTTETASAVLNASGAGAAVYTSISISPTGGAARTISGAIAAGSPLIDLNGADNVTIDGLNTGGNSLTIANTTASATSGTSTIRFIGGATNNLLTNSNIQGSSSSTVATNGGTIFLSTDAVTVNGNDNNTISNNNIGPAGGLLPSKAILCNGSTTTTAIGNSGNIVHNNNIFDYFSATVTSSGIASNGGCNGWSITNNRFYQTGTRTWTTGATHRAIDINNTTATSGAQGFTITGNIVGFATNTQTGTYTLTGSTGKFQGIQFNGITGGAVSNINNNTVASVSLTGVTSNGTSTSSPFLGILVTNGVAITNSNIIGSQAATGSLTFSTTATTATDVYGIFNFSLDDWTAGGNNIGGISVTNLGASGTFLVFGMRANTSTVKLFNATANTVGGAVANSIQLTSTGAASQVIGMVTVNAGATWTSNTVRNLTNNNGSGTSAGASVIGMSSTTSTPSHTISENTIHTLSNTHATVGTVVTGLQFTGGSANVVQRNLIYGLTTASNSTAAEVNGIRVAGGTTIYRNNMIAVGVGIANAIGTGSTTGGVNGINEPLGTDSFFHNSVYVGGAPTAGAGPSYAFNSSQTSNTRSFRDNIFFNARSNAGATGKNYAVRVGGTAPNPAGLTINNNLYSANGTGAVFGFFNSLDVADLAAWKLAVGQDASSFDGNPQYSNPTGAVPDLHIHPTNPTVAEGNGADVGVTDDFDGQTRAVFTPVDIGADAGNFNGIDLAPPAISYTALGNTTLLTNRSLTATLTDVTGVATGGFAPRIYYRKNAGSYFSQACGLTSGTTNNGTWTCVINNVDLGGVVATDVVNYFVIAQDTLGNVASNPAGATAADVNTVSVPPAAPNTYSIVNGYSGSLNVGAAETYTSLTNPGGLFEAINAGALTGNLVIHLTSDLSGELGTNALNQWAEDGVGGYTMLLRPSGAPRTVTGTNAGALIRLNGVDRLTIDGSTTGGTAVGVGGDPLLRELTFQNTNTGTSAVVMSVQTGTNGAQNNTIKNLVLLGQDPTTTPIGLWLGGNTPGASFGVDNDNNRVENVAVRRALAGIFSAGASAANPNVSNVLTRNDLSAAGADRIRRLGITVLNEDGVQITENSVGSISTDESADGIGIAVGTTSIDTTAVTSGGITNALVARNKIAGVASLNTTGFSAVGIALAGGPAGANTIVNNMIDGVTAPATSPDIVAGIWVSGVAGSTTRVYANTVALSGDRGSVASQIGSYALAITGTDPTVEVKDNILVNSQTTTGGGVNAKSYAIGMTSSSFANLDSNFNDFFASGASAGFFRTGSLGGVGTDLATLAAWQAAVTDDANSLSVDPLLASATDLHLTAVSPMLNAGLSLAGVTVDIDGDPRPGGTPDIGADEVLTADLSILKSDGVTTAVPGTTVTYTIVAVNDGPSDSTATVTDTFPASLSGCSTTCVVAGAATCNAGPLAGNLNEAVTLPAGTSVTFTATCTIDAGATGTLDNTATVAGAVIDPDPADNSATDSDTLVPSADLSITKTDGVTTAAPGGSVTYTIVASNAGPSDALGSNVTDTFPATLSCSTTCSGSGGGICTAGPFLTNINDTVDLPAGASVTYTAVCSVSPLATGSLSNTATVSGSVSDPTSGNNSATDTDTLVPSADVSITKTDGATVEIPGSSVTYTIVVSNAGPSAAPTVTVADTFAAILTGCSTTCIASGGASCTAGPIVGNLSTNADLPAGGSATYTATCTISALATGSLVNTATATVGGGVSDPATGNNSATDTDTLDSMPFLDGFETGDTSRWQLTVPLTFEAYADVAAGAEGFETAYDFAAVPADKAFAPTPMAFGIDGLGKPLFMILLQRTEVGAPLEITLEVIGGGRSSWIPAGEVGQQLRLEWSAATQSQAGHLALALDSRLTLWVDGYVATAMPVRLKLLRAPAPTEP